MRDEHEYVQSMMFGLSRMRNGTYRNTAVTRDYPHVPRILNRWLATRLDPDNDLQSEWLWSSITVNKGFASRRHRDANNFGPSIIRQFGTHQAKLRYWPCDGGRPQPKLDELPSCQAKEISVGDIEELIAFDGRKAHETVATEVSDRFSIIFFLINGAWDAKPQERGVLEELGFPTPCRREDAEKFEKEFRVCADHDTRGIVSMICPFGELANDRRKEIERIISPGGTIAAQTSKNRR